MRTEHQPNSFLNTHYRLGVDVGGTNTDICIFNEQSGELIVHKLPSTISDQSIAIETGIQELAQQEGFNFSEITYFCQGTTVATNAILEQKGAKISLITTKGFRDLLEIGRQQRPYLFDLQADKPPPLVTRNRRYEVAERIDTQGNILYHLNNQEVRNLLDSLKNQQVEGFVLQEHEPLQEHGHLVNDCGSGLMPCHYDPQGPAFLRTPSWRAVPRHPGKL